MDLLLLKLPEMFTPVKIIYMDFPHNGGRDKASPNITIFYQIKASCQVRIISFWVAGQWGPTDDVLKNITDNYNL